VRKKPQDHRYFYLAFSLLLIIGYFDYLTGWEIPFEVIYIAPIWIAAWSGGKVASVSFVLLAAIIEQIADILDGLPYLSVYHQIWFFISRLIFFMIIVILVRRIKRSSEAEHRLLEKLREMQSAALVLGSLTPMCRSCETLRESPEYIKQVKDFLHHDPSATFARYVCPECEGKSRHETQPT